MWQRLKGWARALKNDGMTLWFCCRHPQMPLLLKIFAVLVVGYDDATSRWTVRNSWGRSWGDKGYFYMPYAYATNAGLADDFWTIRIVE